jgi:hypothetical protein
VVWHADTPQRAGEVPRLRSALINQKVDALEDKLRRQTVELEKARAAEQAARAQAIELDARLTGTIEDEQAKAEWQRMQGLIHKAATAALQQRTEEDTLARERVVKRHLQV